MTSSAEVYAPPGDRLQRHAQSGKSIAAFCRDQAVSTASFHIWRAKLAAADGHLAKSAAFIDLGAIKNTPRGRPSDCS